jgi:hypothetical protein
MTDRRLADAPPARARRARMRAVRMVDERGGWKGERGRREAVEGGGRNDG